jgi:class 3 adenylate cyclase
MAIEVERTVLARCTVGALWPVITNTDRTNRAVGMAPVQYRPASVGAARFLGSTQLGGFEVEYEERPAEWELERWFRLERRMHGGPISSLQMHFSFESGSSGCQVKLRLVMQPRTALLTPILKLRARQSIDEICHEIERIDGALARGQEPPPGLPPRVNEEALGAALRALRGKVIEPVIERLGVMLRQGDDLDVARMRPNELAERWSLGRRAVLEGMLEGVRAGLLELRWELVCPSCRVAVESVPTLQQLAAHGACQLCEVEFGLEMEDALEVTFAPCSAVRRVQEGPYCIAGPARVPHVLSQGILPPRGVAVLGGPPEPGRYRLFVRGGARSRLLVEAGGPAQIEVSAQALPEELRLGPRGQVRLRNEGEDERHGKIERSTWAQQAVTARELGALPLFRRQFSGELLRPGTTLRVTRVTLLFSDLTGSTQLYAEVGDAAAFRLVQEHFELLFRLIELHGGALVKTIGDAVMAVFAEEMEAVSAAMAILAAFEGFRREQPHGARTHVKLGLFAGPCYAVTANGVLDYFGQTVNVAARLQGQAESGELVVPEATAREALGRGLLDARAMRGQEQVQLKGVEGGMTIARLRVV